MWSDDYYHQQLDDIYARIKREDEYEAKQRMLDEVRSGLPILSEPQLGKGRRWGPADDANEDADRLRSIPGKAGHSEAPAPV